MKTELIHTLTNTFEAHAQQTEGGIEFGWPETCSTFWGTRSGATSIP